MKKRTIGFHIVLSLLLFNPPILFLVFNSVLIALFTWFIGLLLILYTSDRSKLLLPYLINFFLLISFFIYAEAVFRFGFAEYKIDNLYEIKGDYYFNKPNLVKRIEDKEFEITYKTNDSGYRIPASLDTKNRTTECDWLFIGDSFTQGAQVEFQNLYTSQLYRSFPDKVISNAGISGFGIIEEFEYYKNEGVHLKPNKVFLQLCSFNDFMNVKKSRNTFSEYLMQYSDFVRFLLFNIKYKSPGELPLGRWTEPFYSTEKENQDYNIFYKEKSNKQLKDISKFEEYLVKFKEETAKNGSELIVFLIPTKEQVSERLLNEVLTAFQINKESLDLSFSNELLKKLCTENNISFIDLLPSFNENQENIFFEYDEHLTNYGHYLTSETLKEKINTEKETFKLLSNNLLGERYPFPINGRNEIIYQGQRDGNMEIISKNFETDIEKRITYNDIDESHPCLSPSEKYTAFTEGDPEEMETRVCLLNNLTKERIYLNDDSNVFSSIPSFSPNDKLITYAEWTWSEKSKSYSSTNIVVQHLDSMEIKFNITNDENEDWRPIFTPDGESIIFISKRNGQFDIFLRSLKNLSEKQITNTPHDEWDPSISNNGESLIYAAKVDDNWDLFLMNMVTDNVTRITETKGNEWDPFFASNDEKIFFAGEFGVYNCIYEMKLR